jgi:hypothetical protein
MIRCRRNAPAAKGKRDAQIRRLRGPPVADHSGHHRSSRQTRPIGSELQCGGQTHGWVDDGGDALLPHAPATARCAGGEPRRMAGRCRQARSRHRRSARTPAPLPEMAPTMRAARAQGRDRPRQPHRRARHPHPDRAPVRRLGSEHPQPTGPTRRTALPRWPRSGHRRRPALDHERHHLVDSGAP